MVPCGCQRTGRLVILCVAGQQTGAPLPCCGPYNCMDALYLITKFQCLLLCALIIYLCKSAIVASSQIGVAMQLCVPVTQVIHKVLLKFISVPLSTLCTLG